MAEKKKQSKSRNYEIVTRTFTYFCPKRGMVTQTVKGKRYNYLGAPMEAKYSLFEEVDIESISTEDADATSAPS